MDPFSTNQGFSMLNIFKKSKSQASVENTIAVIGVKMALLVGELLKSLALAQSPKAKPWAKAFN